MQLFDDFKRVYKGFLEASEAHYTFLNRSAQVEFEHTRQVLEQWFLSYPELHQHVLKQSFRVKENKIHLGAFFELYCHEWLKQQGFLVQVQQVVDQRVKRPIDFLVSSSHGPLFYLEATLAADSNAISASEQLLWQLYDALNKLNEPLFRVGITVELSTVHSLPTGQISKVIHNWLQTFDPDEVAQKISDYPSYCWERDGWKIRFFAVPRSVEEKEANRNTVLYQSSGIRGVSNPSSLSKALESKTNIYGNFQLPYIIAVDMIAIESFGCNILDVLFGQEVFLIDRQSGETTATRSPLLSGRPSKENGFWVAPGRLRNQEVSAVLLVEELMPWSLAKKTPWLWHNPWAENRLDPELWQGPQMIPDMSNGLKMRYREGKKSWEIFRLDPNWPYNDLSGNKKI